ncbi:helix-turn-helix domain-containing protein [Myxococcus eversor]|uniref:helix-turn-helix domain-containing protein n=1 Tax=Myxococcus eversor TaxID=2709661 RepID=UPI0013D54C40|nr:helix-turn-helix domain-containing protein [Myxococcus eversor]
MKPFAQQTYYELLEVPVTAQMEEIHVAYSRLMELYAPDSIAVYALVDADQVDVLRARMTEAMEILTDADLRVEYDKDLGLPARKVAEAVTAPPPVAEVGPTQRAAEALASAVGASAATSPVATPEVAGKGMEEPEPELSGPAAFRASFVSGYSLSYVTSSLQTAPFGGGFMGMPAAGRMDGGAASTVESGSSAAPVAQVSPKTVDTGTEATAAVSVAAPASVVAEAPSPVAAPVASSSAAPSGESPVVAVVATTVQPEASSPAASSGESPVAASSPSDTAGSSAADASAEAQGAQAPASPAATEPEPEPEPSVPEAPVVAQVPPAPSPVEDVPVPSVAAQPPVAEPQPPTPAPPSTSIVVAPPPSRSTGTSRPTTSPTGASAQTRGPGRQLGDAQVLAQDAAIATAEAAMAQVSARVREARPRLPEIAADAEFNGELLRRVRETRGFTLQQVADRTRISSRHLENVEADRYTLLPPPVYLRGILMNLARELGLDPLQVSRSYLGLASEKSGKK